MLTTPDERRDNPAGDAAYRQPPHNIDAEQALLGAIFLNNQVLDKIPDSFDRSHFFDPLHGEIFDCCSRLHAHGRPVTPVTLMTFFENAEPIIPPRTGTDGTVLDRGLTVPQYLGRLAASATTTFNAPEYARTIRDLALRRSLIAIADDMLAAAYDAPVDYPPEDLIQETEGQLYALSQSGAKEGAQVMMAEAVVEAIDRAALAYQHAGGVMGLATGLTDLDNKLGGIGNGDLVILAGRPSMGKTALATNIAEHHARAGAGNQGPDAPGQRRPFVHFFSMEMSASQLANRIIAEKAEISSHDIRRGHINEDQLRRLIRAAEHQVSPLPVLVDQSGGLTLAKLAARARRIKRTKGTTLLVIDYLQLMSGSKRRSSDNRTNELTEITMGLKALAKELDVPIIALSQLSRQVEQRADKRPQLSDLRESGSIEQDADIVMFTFRENYYVEREQPDPGDIQATLNWQQKMAATHGKAEIIIGKQRHGPTGLVPVAFSNEFTRFSDLAREYQLPERAGP